VVVVFVVDVIVVVVEEEVALAEVLEVVVQDEGDLVVGVVEGVGEEEDEDVEVEEEEVGIFFHLGTFETVTILTGHHRRF
jgi:hypothetical protein